MPEILDSDGCQESDVIWSFKSLVLRFCPLELGGVFFDSHMFNESEIKFLGLDHASIHQHDLRCQVVSESFRPISMGVLEVRVSNCFIEEYEY